MPRSALKHLIQYELEKQAPIIFNKLLIENCLVQNEAVEETKESHAGKCNHCTAILQEVWYKCSVCPDYLVCPVCEDIVEHSHPLLKFKGAD